MIRSIVFHPFLVAITIFISIIVFSQMYTNYSVETLKKVDEGKLYILNHLVQVTEENGRGELEYGDIKFLITRVKD